MFSKQSTSGIKRVLAALLAFVALILLSGPLFINRYLEKRTLRKLSSVIVTGSDSLYRFTVGKLKISFWDGHIDLQDFELQVDSNRFRIMQKERSLPALTLRLSVPRVRITGMSIIPFLFSRKIHVSRIIPENAYIGLSRYFYTAAERPPSRMPLWKSIEKEVRKITVEKLVLDSLRLFYHNADSALAFRWQFNNCSAVLKDIRIDSIGTADTQRILFARDMAISVRNVQLRTVDSLYHIAAASIDYSSAAQRLSLDNFRMRPALSATEFYTLMGRQEDMFHIDASLVEAEGFRLDRWIDHNEVFADSIHLRQPVINIFFNRTLIEIPENRLGKYPPQLLLKAGVGIRVGRLNMEDGSVKYEELADSGAAPGVFTFTRINGLVRNITNHRQDISRDSVCIAELSARFQEQSPLSARFDFFLNSTDGGFAVQGMLSGLDASQISPAASSLANTVVPSLHVEEMNFAVRGNEKQAAGDMNMKYRDLRLVFNRKSGDNRQGQNKFLTRLINRFALRPQNPMPGEPERVARGITYVRDPHKSFFSIVWRTMNACIQYITMNIRGFSS